MTILKQIVHLEKGRKHDLLEEIQQGAIRVFQANDFRNENKPLYTFDKYGVFADVDDIMLVWDGSVGQMGIGRSGYVGSTMVRLRVKDKKQFSPFFIYRLLQTKSEYLKRKATGATIMHINRKSLEQLDIPDLKIVEQRHIAHILSKAENLITQRKESIRLLDEFLKSTFLEMFGDPVRNEKRWILLTGKEYLSKLTVGVVIKPASYYVNEGVLALRSLNIRPNRIQLDNLVYFSKKVNENELSKSILREGDVVFVRTGMTGTAAIITKELDGSNCIDLIISRPKNRIINPQYLVFFFNSDFGKRIVSAKEVGGIQKHFNIGALRNMKIPIPPIELQTKFAEIVEKTEALKAQYQQSLGELENLYGSLSQRAFRGEFSLKNERN